MLWIRHLNPEQLPPREGAANKRKLQVRRRRNTDR